MDGLEAEIARLEEQIQNLRRGSRCFTSDARRLAAVARRRRVAAAPPPVKSLLGRGGGAREERMREVDSLLAQLQTSEAQRSALPAGLDPIAEEDSLCLSQTL